MRRRHRVLVNQEAPAEPKVVVFDVSETGAVSTSSGTSASTNARDSSSVGMKKCDTIAVMLSLPPFSLASSTSLRQAASASGRFRESAAAFRR